jgi:hypothetical protein
MNQFQEHMYYKEAYGKEIMTNAMVGMYMLGCLLAFILLGMGIILIVGLVEQKQWILLVGFVWFLVAMALIVSSAHSSPCPIPLSPQIKKEIPFIKPAGNYSQPKHFDTLKDAEEHKKLKGGVIKPDYITGNGYFIVYAK